MALNAVPVFESRQAARYDGTNAADFNTEINDFSIVSQTPEQLVFNSAGQQYTVARDGYVAWYQGQVSEVFQNKDDYTDTYRGLNAADLNHVHDLKLTTTVGRAADSE